jgi:hypothetical protein
MIKSIVPKNVSLNDIDFIKVGKRIYRPPDSTNSGRLKAKIELLKSLTEGFDKIVDAVNWVCACYQEDNSWPESGEAIEQDEQRKNETLLALAFEVGWYFEYLNNIETVKRRVIEYGLVSGLKL